MLIIAAQFRQHLVRTDVSGVVVPLGLFVEDRWLKRLPTELSRSCHRRLLTFYESKQVCIYLILVR
jgi:hypothetical protein